jgi:hypothetical protein
VKPHVVVDSGKSSARPIGEVDPGSDPDIRAAIEVLVRRKQ